MNHRLPIATQPGTTRSSGRLREAAPRPHTSSRRHRSRDSAFTQAVPGRFGAQDASHRCGHGTARGHGKAATPRPEFGRGENGLPDDTVWLTPTRHRMDAARTFGPPQQASVIGASYRFPTCLPA